MEIIIGLISLINRKRLQNQNYRIILSVLRIGVTASLMNLSKLLLFVLVFQGFAIPSHSRDVLPIRATEIPGNPAYCIVAHTVGKINFAVQNNGTFGNSSGRRATDCLTGDEVSFGAEYPVDLDVEHLYYSSLWVGAVMGNDTVVSTGLDGWAGDGREFHPQESPKGDMVYRSIVNPDAPEFDGAVSEEDYIATYTDTLRGVSKDFFYSRPHKPLYLHIKQKSYAWSYPYAEDIIIVDLEITNIGVQNLHNVYLGLYVDSDIGFNGGYWRDDICGFIRTDLFETECGFIEDTVNIAWTADNDGDPINGKFILKPGLANPAQIIQQKSAPHAFGTRILQTPDEEGRLSYNWWVSNYDTKYDFGPQSIAKSRDFRTGGTGTPEGDKNKYFLMSNNEIDYDQAKISELSSLDRAWLTPDRYVAIRIGRGANNQHLTSFGPFNIETTETVPFTFAFFGAESIHHIPGNGGFLYWRTEDFYEGLDFTDLIENSRWASWIYDNPGVDTDGDGYFGKYHVCVKESTFIRNEWVASDADTTFYEGDGVPDFRGAAPPPAPFFIVTPEVSSLRIRFNGHYSERTRDFLTGKIDFEGYNIYMARDERVSSFALITSNDIENYNKYVWKPYNFRVGKYELFDQPYTKQELTCLYGDSCNDLEFNPILYDVAHPYQMPGFPDSLFYFDSHGSNSDRIGGNSPIQKVYPDALPVPLKADLDTLDESFFTEEGYLKYYEYETVIENLLPTVPYWISVTAFDTGSPQSDLDALETSKTISAQMVYPLSSSNQITGENLKAYIYPNPYRIDAEYRQNGFEGRNEDSWPDYRVRQLHFANLPAKCTISIFSLDGDLIKEFDHDMDPSDPNHGHHDWDMISRNTQEIKSGLYYWTVEDDKGKVQIGKLAIIM